MSNVGSAVPATQMSRIGGVEKDNQSDQTYMQTGTSSSSRHCESGDQNTSLTQSGTGAPEALQQSSALIGAVGGGSGGASIRAQSVSATSSTNSNLATTTPSTATTIATSLPNETGDLTPPKKRVKLSDDTELLNDVVGLRTAILEYNFLKLKNIKYRYVSAPGVLYYF